MRHQENISFKMECDWKNFVVCKKTKDYPKMLPWRGRKRGKKLVNLGDVIYRWCLKLTSGMIPWQSQLQCNGIKIVEAWFMKFARKFVCQTCIWKIWNPCYRIQNFALSKYRLRNFCNAPFLLSPATVLLKSSIVLPEWTLTRACLCSRITLFWKIWQTFNLILYTPNRRFLEFSNEVLSMYISFYFKGGAKLWASQFWSPLNAIFI